MAVTELAPLVGVGIVRIDPTGAASGAVTYRESQSDPAERECLALKCASSSTRLLAQYESGGKL
jgi:hypothetical protein